MYEYPTQQEIVLFLYHYNQDCTLKLALSTQTCPIPKLLYFTICC
ncbi:hypothetical protein IAD21_03807 [Abditibacteriota bacterium]|nr:hypothetical protein IAD21_03807 [Abditibacteriota bacterium]